MKWGQSKSKFSSYKEESKKGRRGHHGGDRQNGSEGEVCMEKVILSIEQGIKTQSEVEIVCEDMERVGVVERC